MSIEKERIFNIWWVYKFLRLKDIKEIIVRKIVYKLEYGFVLIKLFGIFKEINKGIIFIKIN